MNIASICKSLGIRCEACGRDYVTAHCTSGSHDTVKLAHHINSYRGCAPLFALNQRQLAAFTQLNIHAAVRACPTDFDIKTFAFEMFGNQAFKILPGHVQQCAALAMVGCELKSVTAFAGFKKANNGASQKYHRNHILTNAAKGRDHRTSYNTTHLVETGRSWRLESSKDMQQHIRNRRESNRYFPGKLYCNFNRQINAALSTSNHS